MTRIRTSGFSMKIISAKLRRLLSTHPYRIAGCGFLLAVLLHSLLTAGCARGAGGGGGGGGNVGLEVDGFVLKEEEIEGLRFVPGEIDPMGNFIQLDIQPAKAYWLIAGEGIAPRWDTFEWHWERKGAMCAFNDNTSTDDCKVCNYCSLPPNVPGGPPCFGERPDFGDGRYDIVYDEGFIQTDNPKFETDLVNSFNPATGSSVNPHAACSSNSSVTGLTYFRPTNALYYMRSGQSLTFMGRTMDEDEIKIHVVPADGPRTTAYQIPDKFTETENGANGPETHDYWVWTMDLSSLWDENFSPNLRVTDIRIFKGKCSVDPTLGGKCAIPPLSLPVKPSRILFLPNFRTIGSVALHLGVSSHRCYSVPNISDPFLGNFINLASCLETSPTNTTPSPQRKDVTPAYDTDSGPPLVRRPLTWLIEFNTNEGADADLTKSGLDPMPPNAELIIEFTIQVK